MKKYLSQYWSRITAAHHAVTMTTNKLEGETVRVAVAWDGVGHISIGKTPLTNNENYATGDNTFNEVLVPTDGKLELIVSGKAELVYLCCSGNQLKRLDVTNSTSLKWLDCSQNELKSLDVTSCNVLHRLFCVDNKLTNIDLANCPELEIESVQQLQTQSCRCITKKSSSNSNPNALATMMTAKPTGEAIRIAVAWNGSGSVTANGTVLTNNEKYTTGNCSYDDIVVPIDGSIELTSDGDVELVLLLCYANQLISLDLANSPALKSLNCSNNLLKRLSVSHCTELTELDCSYNSLKSLDVANCKKLKDIYASYNMLGRKKIKKA